MIFRKTDGYTEVSAVPEGNLVELFVTYPGNEGYVLHAHFSAKLAWRLGVWLLWYWLSERWFGLRTIIERRKNKELIFAAAMKESDQ